MTALAIPPGLIRLSAIGAFLVASGLSSAPAHAHPHVFIDGGVDFQFDESAHLTSLEVTWLYDEFETLYILAANNLSLNSDGALDAPDLAALKRKFSDWPEDFDGSAHLSLNGRDVSLDWPSAPEVELVDGRIKAVFTRQLETPVDVQGERMELAFYERTYFFAFKITNTPRLIGPNPCSADLLPFSPDPNDASLLAKLAQLSREEIPENENVGLLFADRIALTCE